jgi:hypothetical protein
VAFNAITKRKQAEAELQQAKESAEAATAPSVHFCQHEPRESHPHERRHWHDGTRPFL